MSKGQCITLSNRKLDNLPELGSYGSKLMWHDPAENYDRMKSKNTIVPSMYGIN